MSGHTVRIVARIGRTCSGVVIDATAVVTAAHCAGYGATVLSGGAPAKVASVTSSIVRADGTRIRVAGDAAILKLATPVYASPVSVSSGASGNHFTVAGFGTTNEQHPGAVGGLHEASSCAPARMPSSIRTARARSARAPASATPAAR